MRVVRRLVAGGITAAALLLWPAAAHAHPLGNFTVNLYDGLVLSPGRVRLLHIVDMAEIPTFQELRQIDASGEPSVAELAAWAGHEARSALRGLWLVAGSRRVILRVEASRAELRPGQGGLPTLRLEATYVGDLPPSGNLEFRDRTYEDRIGWREMTATASGELSLRSSVPAVSASGALRAYPEDLLSAPLRVVRATVTYGPGPARPFMATTPDQGGTQLSETASGGGFADLVDRRLSSPATVAVALILALAFGALHALGPGHGKTITAAYLVSSGGRLGQVTGVALAVAGMHTASVLLLGMIVVSAQRALPAERVYPWIGMLSGGLAMALGTGLLTSRLVGKRGHGHRHHTRPSKDRPLSRRGLVVLAGSGGLLPSPTALIALLGSIALGRAAFGVALLAAFSVGLAAALALVGMVAVGARSHLAPRLGRWGAILPIGSASAIIATGALLVARAALQL